MQAIRTVVLAIDPLHPEAGRIEQAAGALRRGDVVGVPTDTIYGLAANPFDTAAIERVYEAKGRDDGKPLSLMVAGVSQAEALAGAPLSELFYRLAGRFWPGPLTLIIPAAAHLPRRLTAGGDTIALRQPLCPIVLSLIDAAGFPITATSANRSGAADCRSAEEVRQQLEGRIPLIVDGGPSPRALPSTLVDLTSSVPKILRAGAIREEELQPLLQA